jgi:hypothetical protein
MESFKIIDVQQAKLTKENLVLLGYYAASSGNFLPKFRYNLRVQESWTRGMGAIVCTETSVIN